jgi:hypothetical protein
MCELVDFIRTEGSSDHTHCWVGRCRWRAFSIFCLPFLEIFLTLFTLNMQLVTNYVHTQLIQDNVYLLLIWLSYVRILKFDTDI